MTASTLSLVNVAQKSPAISTAFVRRIRERKCSRHVAKAEHQPLSTGSPLVLKKSGREARSKSTRSGGIGFGVVLEWNCSFCKALRVKQAAECCKFETWMQSSYCRQQSRRGIRLLFLLYCSQYCAYTSILPGKGIWEPSCSPAAIIDDRLASFALRFVVDKNS